MCRTVILAPPSENYRLAAEAAGLNPVVLDELDSAEHYDGLILPGGSDMDPGYYGEENTACGMIEPERDREQLNALRLFAEAGKPVLGICRGHQLINVYFGGSLLQHIPEVDAHGWHGCDSAHWVKAEPGSVLYTLYGERFQVNSAHHQAVKRLGEGLEIILTAEDGVVEGIRHQSLPILGVQFHPERMCCGLRREDNVDGMELLLWFRAKMEH